MGSLGVNRLTKAPEYVIHSQMTSIPPAPINPAVLATEDPLPYTTGSASYCAVRYEPISKFQQPVDSIEVNFHQAQHDVEADHFLQECDIGYDWSMMQQEFFPESFQEQTIVNVPVPEILRYSPAHASIRLQDPETLYAKLRELRSPDYKFPSCTDTRLDSLSQTSIGVQQSDETQDFVPLPWPGFKASRSCSDQSHSRNQRQRCGAPRALLPRSTSLDQKLDIIPEISNQELRGGSSNAMSNDNPDVLERREKNRVASIRFRERRKERQKSLSQQLNEYKVRSRLLEDTVQSLKARLKVYHRLLFESDINDEIDKP